MIPSGIPPVLFRKRASCLRPDEAPYHPVPGISCETALKPIESFLSLMGENHSAKSPLCVDLDGTLIKTDLLWESLLALLKQNPLSIFLLPVWLLRGRAYLKHQIAQRVTLDASTLPYDQELVEFLSKERLAGRELILATASHVSFAQVVATHLGLFDGRVFGSDSSVNLKGARKVALLVERYGTRRFAYAGNSTADFPVWAEASEAIVVNASAGVASRARTLTTVSRVFRAPVNLVKQVAKALRVHQWSKNVLVFVPGVASHQLANGWLLLQASLAFLSFSLCASAVYIVNDCLDLESDRRHPRKRNRPFASGNLSIPFGLALAAVCLIGGVLLALALPSVFLLVLGGYLALTTGYSFYLKQFVLVDVIVLAQLYTVRVYGGGAATGVPPSHWLLTFSLFLFLSLALVKRFTELRLMSQVEGKGLHGRGYWVTDLEHISSIGTASGLLAVLVLALYISSKEVLLLYSHAEVLWLVCPVMLYWISRVWMLAYRNRMDDDPVVFAVKDPKSYAMAGIIAAILFFAK
ncbi:MAG TPA: UbiA family prenyltransferase [Nitrospira sp.]|nr:UbiA family prenyltransferase [Nitrospira sp.]HNG54451.1 UbiA family prenyltransferase [Nitrospira sp.]HNJ19601.1 UbiA family prenyltransferase [Nitrospira sp.]HNK48453.1 UbiA family prenyltransferase [Nitrospira sp.]HNK76685.1 UbiA family prenyltransferase [Nitrospira sp.]